jgi:hypothetical protein
MAIFLWICCWFICGNINHKNQERLKMDMTKEEVASLYRIYSDYGANEKEHPRVMGVLGQIWDAVRDKDEVRLRISEAVPVGSTDKAE